MKNIYINSRLHPLLIAARTNLAGKNWIFSMGERWLLITPGRMARLAAMLGPEDGRLYRLVALIRRHSPRPEAFCRRLGLPETRYVPPEEYPPVFCPRCEFLHRPHPEEAGGICPECRREADRAEATTPGGGVLRDRAEDRLARQHLLEKIPSAFDGDVLSPNYQYNKHRRLQRDWHAAVNRILMGAPYRQVSREFNCSVGLLHKKVVEQRHWENN